jgi:hypothetical protein
MSLKALNSYIKHSFVLIPVINDHNLHKIRIRNKDWYIPFYTFIGICSNDWYTSWKKLNHFLLYDFHEMINKKESFLSNSDCVWFERNWLPCLVTWLDMAQNIRTFSIGWLPFGCRTFSTSPTRLQRRGKLLAN